MPRPLRQALVRDQAIRHNHCHGSGGSVLNGLVCEARHIAKGCGLAHRYGAFIDLSCKKRVLHYFFAQLRGLGQFRNIYCIKWLKHSGYIFFSEAFLSYYIQNIVPLTSAAFTTTALLAKLSFSAFFSSLVSASSLSKFSPFMSSAG